MDQAINVFSLNHATLWFMIGLWIPHRYDWVIILSFVWEILETYATRQPIWYELLKTYWIIPEKYWNEPIQNKITDIGFNLIGYSLASRLIQKEPQHFKQFFYPAFGIFVFTVVYAIYQK
jgi:hypothetical protein